MINLSKILQFLVIAPLWGIFFNTLFYYILEKGKNNPDYWFRKYFNFFYNLLENSKCLAIWNFSFTLSIFIFALSLLLWPSLSLHVISGVPSLVNVWVFGAIYTYGLDHISLFFVILTTFIFPLCFLYS
jgi:hypothetical protein